MWKESSIRSSVEMTTKKRGTLCHRQTPQRVTKNENWKKNIVAYNDPMRSPGQVSEVVVVNKKERTYTILDIAHPGVKRINVKEKYTTTKT